MFRSHRWPGNVRELRNVLTRFAVLERLDPNQRQSAGFSTLELEALEPLREAREKAMALFEEQYLREALARHRGNVPVAADAMGISRQFAYRLLARYGIR